MLAQALKSLRVGEIDVALETLRGYVADHPDDPEGHHLLGVVLRAAGDAEAATASIDRAIELAPNTAAFHFSRAAVLLDGCDLIRARAELLKTLEADPNQLSAYIMLAHLALSSGDHEEAERLLRLAFRVDSEHPQALIVQGQLLEARGEADAALATLTRALQRAPEDPVVQSTLGLAYLARGHDAFAAELLAKALRHRPQARGLRWALVHTLRQQDRLDEALAEVEALLDECPDDPPALALRGDLHLRRGRVEEALADYRRLLELAPRPTAVLGTVLGTLLNHGQRQAARDLVEERLRREPLDDLLWQARARIEAGDFQAHGEIVQRWAAALPQSTAALEAQALRAEHEGDWTRARALAERACAGEDNRPAAEFVLVRADIRENPSGALPRLERALAAAQGGLARRLVLFWQGLAHDRLDHPAAAVASWRQMLEHPAPGLPLPASAPAEAGAQADGGPVPKLLWTLPGARPERLAAMLSALPCALTHDRFGSLPRADGLGPVKAVDELGRPAEALPTWRRLLVDRGLDPESVVEWIPNWDARLAARLPGSRLLVLLRDPRDLLLNMALHGAPQHYQVPNFEVAAAWLMQALGPLLSRVENGDPAILLLRGEELDHDPAAALERIAAFFGLEQLSGFGYSEPPPSAQGGLPLNLPDGHWRRYQGALAEPFETLAPLAARLGY